MGMLPIHKWLALECLSGLEKKRIPFSTEQWIEREHGAKVEQSLFSNTTLAHCHQPVRRVNFRITSCSCIFEILVCIPHVNISMEHNHPLC
jgi:hypothetical protein